MTPEAMDGPSTTAHGALLVVLALLLCGLAAPAGAHAASKPYIVVYKTRSAATGRSTTKDIAAEEGVRPTQRFGAAMRGFAAKLDATDLRDIRSDPRVAKVVPDRPVRALGLVPIVTGDNIPPGVRRVGAAVDSTVREASRVNVAVIDTGIDLTHPDLNAVAGTDCTGSGTAQDGNGHGTHVAGTIGARNDGSGAVGVAPGTKLWAVRVLGSNGSGATSQVICGIDWVTATRTDADPNNDIAVANMSLGGSAPPSDNCGRSVGDAMHIAICNSVAAGVTYVVAAGNSGTDEQNFAPASYPEVITVTAMGDSDGVPGGLGAPLSCYGGSDDTPAGFSNFATRAADIAHTIAAPGVCIRSTYPGGYATLSGTSMASPHVAGLGALCEGDGAGVGPCWGKSPADVVSIVRQASADRSAADPASGFAGDPTRPTTGRYYGYLGSTRFPGNVPAVAPAVTVKPAIIGSPSVGTALSSSPGTWAGTAPIAYALQWLRCTTVATTSCSAITGATAASYTPVAADGKRYLRLRVTASNVAGALQSLSEPTAPVVVPVYAPGNTVAPAVRGSGVTGTTMSSTNGTWTGTATIKFTRQWLRCSATDPGACVGVVSTSTSYKPVAADVGQVLRVLVTASNKVGAAQAMSAPSVVVTAAVLAPSNVVKPAVGGTAVVGATLSSAQGTWNGTAPIAYARQWVRCTSATTTACGVITGATGETYSPVSADVGRWLRVRVTASNIKGSVSVLSGQTTVVTGG